MYYQTTIEKVSEDSLSRVEYAFILFDRLEIVLDSVVYCNRPTKRHNWKRVKGWNRLQSRHNDMPREEPPQDVKDAVIQRINADLKFVEKL